MNQNHHSPQPTPRPLCAAFEPLLPLLSLSQLDAEETTSARAHVATCDYCQSLVRDYDMLHDALRRDDAGDDEAARAMPALTLAAILTAADGARDAARDEAGTTAPATGPRRTRSGTAASRWYTTSRRARGLWAGAGAAAAVLLLGILAATLFGRPGGQFGATAIPGLGTLATYPLPTRGSQPRAIIAGPDGNLWFTENGAIGRMTPRGVLTAFALPGGATPLGLTVGPDGAIWFTYVDDVGGKIGRLNPRDGHMSTFPAPTGDSPAGPIVAGPDGAVWFILAKSGSLGSGPAASAIGRITTEGNVTTFPLPTPHPPNDLAVGSDGALWFTTWGAGHDTIGRMTLSGSIAQFPTPDFNGQPTRLVRGPDGNLWFLEAAGLIGRVTPQGAITEFSPRDGASLSDLAVGPDGNLWFTDGSYLGQITQSGAIKEFALPHGIAFNGLVLGPDHDLWLTSIAANSISHLELTR